VGFGLREWATLGLGRWASRSAGGLHEKEKYGEGWAG
jgi:hypothetical protein